MSSIRTPILPMMPVMVGNLSLGSGHALSSSAFDSFESFKGAGKKSEVLIDEGMQKIAKEISVELNANRKSLDLAHDKLGPIALRRDFYRKSLNRFERWVYSYRHSKGWVRVVFQIMASLYSIFKDRLGKLQQLDYSYCAQKAVCLKLLDREQAIQVCQSVIVGGAVKGRRDLLGSAPAWMLNSPEIALKLAGASGSTLGYMSEERRSDKRVVLAAVKNSGASLKMASEALRQDREVALAAAQCNEVLPNVKGEVLRCMSPELQGDRELVLTAVSRDGVCLQYASPELREDRELVKVALSSKYPVQSFQALPKLLQEDKEIALVAVKKQASIYQYLCADLQKDDDIRKAASPYLEKAVNKPSSGTVLLSPTLGNTVYK